MNADKHGYIYTCLVPMLQRGNAYHMGSHAGAWEREKEKIISRKEAQKEDIQ